MWYGNWFISSAVFMFFFFFCLNPADIIRKRAEDIPLLTSPVFLFFLQVSEVFSFSNSGNIMSRPHACCPFENGCCFETGS